MFKGILPALILLSAASLPSTIQEPQDGGKSTTTAGKAAECKQRETEGKGCNENDAKELKRLDEEEKQAYGNGSSSDSGKSDSGKSDDGHEDKK